MSLSPDAEASTPSSSAETPASGLKLSDRVRNLQPSPIRETLSVINRPGMISFAGGLPSPESFPTLKVTSTPGVLQYGASEGDTALREHIAADLQALGLNVSTEQVLILSGSQQGIDLVGKLFVDAGTTVAMESPTYLAALQVFRFFGARFRSFDIGQPDSLQWESGAGEGDGPALAYAIPTFQNPTGHCYTLAQRQALAAACDAQQVVLFEDDPYRDLVFGPCERRPVCSFIRSASWIYQGSFSKTLAPGLRLGYLAASKDLFPYLLRLKQAADLHSNRLSQHLVLEQLQDRAYPERLRSLASSYGRKRDLFEAQLRKYFGEIADWQTPQGGLFFWLTLNEPLDTRTLLSLAIARNVAFMPGEYFYADAPVLGTLRLNFSHAEEADVARGLKILADLIHTNRM